MKIAFVLLLLLFNGGCSQLAVQSQQGDSVDTKPTPEAAPTPFTFPRLSKDNLERLDERLPSRSREILEKTDLIQVFETKICLAGRSLAPIEQNKFQGCDILRRAEITDPQLRKQLLEGMFYAIGSSGLGAACSSPRHGVRAEYPGKRIEMLICFQCENFRGASNFGNFGGGFSRAPQELFEQILRNSPSGRNE